MSVKCGKEIVLTGEQGVDVVAKGYTVHINVTKATPASEKVRLQLEWRGSNPGEVSLWFPKNAESKLAPLLKKYANEKK